MPDTPAKRREYQEEIVRTFYLSNAELKETIDLLRIVVDARRVAGMPGTNAITIKDSPERIAAAGRVIAAIDKARPEVVLDVELLEVDRTKLRDYGLQIASPGSPGISGSADVNRQQLHVARSPRTSTQSDVFLTGVPALFYRLLKSDTNTRTLANPQLRTTDGVAAQARFGERVPVPVTTFSPIATGGVPQQPITSFNYENIGVNIDITPRTHHNDDVSLTMKVEVSSISGTGFGGLPTFGTRYINTVLRLRDGETNVLAGLIRDDERVLLEGVPGLSDIPGLGQLFTRTRKEAQETDILLTLTPHIVRVLDLSEADLRPFRVRSGPAAPLIDLPAPEPRPPAISRSRPRSVRPHRLRSSRSGRSRRRFRRAAGAPLTGSRRRIRRRPRRAEPAVGWARVSDARTAERAAYRGASERDAALRDRYGSHPSWIDYTAGNAGVPKHSHPGGTEPGRGERAASARCCDHGLRRRSRSAARRGCRVRLPRLQTDQPLGCRGGGPFDMPRPGPRVEHALIAGSESARVPCLELR